MNLLVYSTHNGYMIIFQLLIGIGVPVRITQDSHSGSATMQIFQEGFPRAIYKSHTLCVRLIISTRVVVSLYSSYNVYLPHHINHPSVPDCPELPYSLECTGVFVLSVNSVLW
jgi:hypothetical protein